MSENSMATLQATLNVEQAISSDRYVYLIAAVAALGGFLFGYDLVIIAGAQIYLKNYFHLQEESLSYASSLGFAMSSAILGCMAGPLIGAWMCDRIGRRNTLFLTAILFGISGIGTALPRTINEFNIFRIIGGIGIGISSIAAPMYIAEVATSDKRGRLGVMYQLAICLGCLASAVVANLFARVIAPEHSWRWMFGSSVLPSLLFFVCLFMIPKSPRWLVSKRRSAEAFGILERINGTRKAKAELREIENSLAEESGSIRELLQPGLRVALLVGIILAVLNNWTGASMIGYYMPILFQKAGFGEADALLPFLAMHVANTMFTIISLYLVDSIGRRPLWIIGSIAMAVGTAVLGAVFLLNMKGWVVALIVLLCIWPHALALGPLPWLMMSEIFPNRIRGRAVSFCTLLVWFAGFTGTYAFPIIYNFFDHRYATPAGAFWIFTALCLLSAVFGFTLLPETKGRSLEEIGHSWMHRG